MKNLLTPERAPLTKCRIGRNLDGGYVLLSEPLAESPIVYSYGIGAETSFDEHCAALGKTVWMYDHTIAPPTTRAGLTFRRLPFTREFFQHIDGNGHAGLSTLTLKVDTEGGEWDGLLHCDERAFACFSQIAVEFHGLDASNPNQRPVLNRLLERYHLVHLHGNNACGRSDWLPHVLELTFLRRDVASCARETRPYPVAGLDFPNRPGVADYVLDWWC